MRLAIAFKDLLARSVHRLKNSRCVFQQHTPRIGRNYPARGAVKQFGPELVLESKQLLAERGLRNAEAFSRLGYRCAAADHHEIAKLGLVHFVFRQTTGPCG